MNARTTPTLPFHGCSVHMKPEIHTLHTNYSSRNEEYESIPQDSHAALWTTQHLLFGTWYPLLQYQQHWLQLLKPFVRFTVSSRFDHQTRTVASAPRSVDSLGVATGRPTGPYRHARRRQRRCYGATRLSCARNTGI